MIRVLPAGPFAVLAEVADVAEAQALYAALRARPDAGRLELVPAARTVLIAAHPTAAGRAGLDDVVASLDGLTPADRATDAGPPLEVPVRYDGADLAGTADLLGITTDDLVRDHADAEYRVAFCGFAPGFGYLTGLPPRLHVPRLPDPRTRVPAGSVGLAGEFCGVYPRESPGGWRLLGRTDVVLFDPARDPAALLAPGTRVRFTPVDR